MPADCCIEQFALGAGRWPFRCLGLASFENLQTMEVQIFADGRESECIDQLCLWMVQAQIAERETWHFGPFLPLVESREERLRNSSAPLGRFSNGCSRQLSARDIEKTIYVDRHGCMKESADECRRCSPCQPPMKRIAERKSCIGANQSSRSLDSGKRAKRHAAASAKCRATAIGGTP